MNEFKIGGTVTIDENETQIIVDIVKIDDITYYFSATKTKPIIPKVFRRIDEGKNTFIEIIEDKNVIKKVLEKVVKG